MSNYKYSASEPEFIGKIPIRQDIEVIPADIQSSRKIGFIWHEITEEEAAERDSVENSNKRKMEREASNLSNDPNNNLLSKMNSHGYTVIPILEFLKGKPWNNMALNVVQAVRPSSIRVTTGCITLDCSNWRVTVYLEEDEKTIKKIEQEVTVGLIGCRDGQDISLYINGKEDRLEQPRGTCFCNPRGIAKLKIEIGEE